jgi:hypothetical protein
VNGHVEHWWRDNSALLTEPPPEEHVGQILQDHLRDAVRNEGARVGGAIARNPGLDALLQVDSPVARRAARAALNSAVLVSEPSRLELDTRLDVDPASLVIRRWQRSATFGHDVKHVWGLLEGSFGFNLEVIVETTGGGLQHYYRGGDGWHEGEIIDV